MVTFDRQGAVGIVTLDRPPVNAIDSSVLDCLDAICQQVESGDAARVLVVRSAQRVFCAGVDIHMITELLKRDGDGSHMLAFVRRIQAVFARWRALPVPTIAAVSGAATGGGLELSMSCDLRVAAADARMGLTEVKIGLLPGAGGTQLLTRLAGPGVAARMILSGELIDGTEAERLGIVHCVREASAVEGTALEWAEVLATKPASALREIKRCLLLAPSPEGYAAEIEGSARLLADPKTLTTVADFFAARR